MPVFSAALDVGVVDVVGGEVGQRPAAPVLELDPRLLSRSGRRGPVASVQRLQL